MRVSRWLWTAGVIAVAILVVVLLRCRRDERVRMPVRTGSAGAGDAPVTPATPTPKPRPRPPVGGLRLEGQVIDEADRPVAGATVRFYNFDGEATTADDGSFAFENLGPHAYQVVAEASEDTWCDMVEVELTATSEPVILRVFPGATATVHVVDAADKKPIAGARITDRRADANGDVKLRGLRPGSTHILILGVEADGYERARAKLTDLDLGTPSENVFVVELRRGVTVSGIVVGPSGEIVTDGEVTASVDKRTRSDTEIAADGTWKLTLAAGSFEIAASAGGRESPIQIVELDGIQPRDGIVLRLPPAKPVPAMHAVLEGIVVDERGAPVAGADVAIAAGAIDATEKTDARGRFRATLAPGADSVTASARKGDVASAEVTVDVKTERVEVRIVVGPATIAGTVVDGRGRPAPGVRVSLRVPFDAINTLSDARGAWELRGLVPGEHPVVVAPNDLEYSRATPLVMAATGDRDVRLVVTYAGGVKGRVVQDGKPVTYFGAFVEEGDPILDRPVLVRAADGRFAIRGIVAGTWRIIVAGPSFGRKTVTGVVVPENDDVDLGDIVVERGRALHGRVTDGSGAGVAGAQVIVHERDERLRDSIARAVQGTGTATTDANGVYRIDNLAPSMYAQRRHVIAMHPTRGVSIERPLGDRDTEINLVIAKAGGIDGRLDGIDSGVSCTRIDDGARGFEFAAATDAAGKFRFDDLAPGRYRVRPNRTAAEVAIVNILGGQRARVTLSVPRERVELQIAATDCTTVTLATADGVDILDEEACAIANVPPGAYRACADGRCQNIDVRPQPAKQAFSLR